MMAKRIFIALLMTLGVLNGVWTVPVYAQMISYDPVLVQRSVRPGSSLTYTINVTNEDQFAPLIVEISAADILEDLQGTYRVVQTGSSAFSLAEWVTVEPQRLVIPPRSDRQVEVTVNVPRGTFGGRYGAVVVSPAPEQTRSSDAAVEVSPLRLQYASFLELEILGGAVRREAYVSNLSVAPSSEHPSIRAQVGDNAVVYSAEVTNAGNIHVFTRGELMIRTAEGRVVTRNPIGGGRGIILPDSTVALRAITRANLPPGEYTARVIVDYGGRRPAISEMAFTATPEEYQAAMVDQQEMSRLWLEPDELEIPVRPGAFNTSIVSITNHGAEPVDVIGHLQKLEFSLTGDFVPEADRGVLPEWITLNPETFTIQPGRTQRVRITLRPPADTFGGYYGDLVFQGRTETVTTEVGSNLLVFVGTDIERSATVQFTEIRKEDNATHFDCLVLNEGNYHLDAAVDFALRQVIPEHVDEETGRIFARRTETMHMVNLPAGGNPILPGTERLIRFSVPLALGAGEYEAIVRVDYGGPEPAMDGIGMIFDEGEDIDD